MTKIFLANSPSENSNRPPEKRNLDKTLVERIDSAYYDRLKPLFNERK